MRVLFAAICLTTLALAADEKPRHEVVKKELEKFQGTWQLVSGQQNGSKLPQPPPELLAKSRSRYEGNREVVIFEGKDVLEVKKTITLDPSKDPKHLDQLVEYCGRKEVQRHIYKIDGDTLTVATCDDDSKRPSSFEQDGVYISVFKRSKNPDK